MRPEVSVIVPIYNVEQYIGHCAKSLFEQTVDNVEYLFINDCTPDRSIKVLLQVLELYPRRMSQVKIINHDVNRGVSKARNTGLDAVQGRLVCFVDGDDFVEPGYLENFIVSSAIADCCICGYFADNATVVYSSERMYGKEDLTRCVFDIGEQGGFGFVWNKCFRMDIIRENHMRFNEDVNQWEDMVFVLYYLLASKTIMITKEVLYHYRIRRNSAMRQASSFESIINYVINMNHVLRQLHKTDYTPYIYQQMFAYILFCVDNVYVNLSVPKKNRLLFLIAVESMMGNLDAPFPRKQSLNCTIVHRILSLKNSGLKDVLFMLLGCVRKIKKRLINGKNDCFY
jgi:glycosyltransferase involved in cell wall biosynthesis